MSKRNIYLIGSLRNPRVPEVAQLLRKWGYEVFDDWFSPGPQADEEWQKYEHDRGRSYQEALDGYHAKNVFDFDYRHLSLSDAVVLVMPAGRSGHLELGWAVGAGKPAFVLFDQEPERYDIMYRFVYCTGGAVCFNTDELLTALEDV